MEGKEELPESAAGKHFPKQIPNNQTTKKSMSILHITEGGNRHVNRCLMGAEQW